VNETNGTYDQQWLEAFRSRPAEWDHGADRRVRNPSQVAHGHQRLGVEKRLDEVSYLPASPAADGIYMALGLAYALIPGLPVQNFFELYHAASDVDVPRRAYITDVPVAKLYGTEFHTTKHAHRLHWVQDHEQAKVFMQFLESYMFKDSAKARMWSIWWYVMDAAYPDGGLTRRSVATAYAVPYRRDGAFDLARPPGPMLDIPVFAFHEGRRQRRKVYRCTACNAESYVAGSLVKRDVYQVRTSSCPVCARREQVVHVREEGTSVLELQEEMTWPTS